MSISCKSSEACGRQQISTRIVFFVAGFGLASWAPLVPFAKARVGIDEGALALVFCCASELDRLQRYQWRAHLRRGSDVARS
jgi:hypothetical protein